MKTMTMAVLAVLLISGTFLGGCATEVPIFTNARSSRLEGVELYNRGDYEMSVGSFRNAVKDEPRDFRSQYYLGLSYENLGNYQQAIQAYRSALRVMRETPAGRDASDFRQLVMNSLATSIAKHDDNAIEQNLLAKEGSTLSLPSHIRAESYFVLAKVNRIRGDADAALQNYYLASELADNDYWLQREAGLYLQRMGKNLRAVKPLRRAIAMNNRDQEVAAAMQQLNLAVPTPMVQTGGGPAPAFKAIPLPDVELQLADAGMPLPQTLPRD